MQYSRERFGRPILLQSEKKCGYEMVNVAAWTCDAGSELYGEGGCCIGCCLAAGGCWSGSFASDDVTNYLQRRGRRLQVAPLVMGHS